jgi:hypothetical protein
MTPEELRKKRVMAFAIKEANDFFHDAIIASLETDMDDRNYI